LFFVVDAISGKEMHIEQGKGKPADLNMEGIHTVAALIPICSIGVSLFQFVYRFLWENKCFPFAQAHSDELASGT
jgi:hypothetical protein